VSTKYLASEFIREKELFYFLEKEIQIYWFLIEECSWRLNKLRTLQCANIKDGVKLVPLNLIHPGNQSKIFTKTSQNIYERWAELKNGAKPAHTRAYDKTIPKNFRFNYNRDDELNLAERCYRYHKKNESLLLFSIEGDPVDSLETFYQSFIYKSLYIKDKEIDYDKVLDLKINIKNNYQYNLISPDNLKGMFINDFYNETRRKLDIGANDTISYKSIAKKCGQKIEWLVISVNIPATSFCPEFFDVIFSWLYLEFNKDNYTRKNFKMAFIFSFESSADTEMNKKMNHYINKGNRWFIPLYQPNYSAVNTEKEIVNPFVHHLGVHGKTTLNYFEEWCDVENFKFKETYQSIKKNLTASSNNLGIKTIWGLFDHLEKA
jgi:hypothetical protein